MNCNYRKHFFIVLLFVFVITSTFGRRGGGGGGRSHSRGGGFFSGSRSSSHRTSHTSSTSHNGASYPKQTGSSNTNYGWKTNTGGNKYNSNPGQGHFYNSNGQGHHYNSPSSTNWGSSYNSPSYHPQQNAFGTFQPVSSGIAPSYHFHRSTSYVPIYIPGSHTYIHRHYTDSDGSTSSTTTNNTPPPPPSEPVIYKEESSSDLGEGSTPSMIVGFNNMIVYGIYEKDKHFLITVSEDLDEDMDEIPERFLHTDDNNLFEIVTMKPTTTTTTTTVEPFTTTEASEASEFTTTGVDNDEWTTEWGAGLAALKFLATEKETIKTKLESDDRDDNIWPSGANFNLTDYNNAINLYFGDMIP